MSELPLVLLVDDAPVPPALAAYEAVSVSSEELAAHIEGVPAGRTVVVVAAEARAPQVASAIDGELAEAPTVDGLDVVEMAGPSAGPPQSDDGPLPGWQRGLAEMGGTLSRDRLPMLPESLHRMAPVRQVFEGAGERALVQTAPGETWVACGFPDLRRQRSKVLLLRDADPRPEIIALHRHPKAVGLVAERARDGLLPGADWDPDPLAVARTGQPLRTWGELFAVETDAVYTLRGGRVWRWDGFHDKEMGTPSQATATLVLRWSQR